ncbi:MAG: hypothetical protein IT577_14885 [Verrucomicrobiae bacterium]|nr:hypothetical protein [Verrucomicrobiae bacterium]
MISSKSQKAGCSHGRQTAAGFQRLPVTALLIATGIAVGIATILVGRRDATPQAAPAEIASSHPARTTTQPPPRPAPVRRVLAETQRLNSPETSPQEDAVMLGELIRAFRRNSKGNPVGDNDEITAQLLGRHPRAPAVGLIDPNNPAIDDQGRLIDRWGTPYFFHALSANQMEIRSAGPDRTMWTPDDVVGDGE